MKNKAIDTVSLSYQQFDYAASLIVAFLENVFQIIREDNFASHQTFFLGFKKSLQNFFNKKINAARCI